MSVLIDPNPPLLFEKKERLPLLLEKELKYALITNDLIAGLYGNVLERLLKQEGFIVSLFTIPDGESFKTRQTKQIIEDAMLSYGYGRDSAIIALGGGVVTDLAGFVAATYCRGIPFISIPTTLLAMVDACIGGKTGVNASQGKNLIGAYYSPSMILIDISFLKTLSKPEFRNGHAEMIKYGLIASAPLFELLEKRDNAFLFECIQKSMAIKQEIVEADFLEKGKRRMLNFGHTVGHALEALLNYQISHGEAVACGMAFETFLSFKLGYLTACDYNRIINILMAYSFPLHLPKTITYENLVKTFSLDKKAISSVPRFVLLDAIGHVLSFNEDFCKIVDPSLLKNAYEHFSN